MEEYDPLWCFIRSTRRSDYLESISRFVQQLQRSARETRSRVTLSVTDCWLPLRVPSLAQLERQLPASLEPLLDLLRSSLFLRLVATSLYRVRFLTATRPASFAETRHLRKYEYSSL